MCCSADLCCYGIDAACRPSGISFTGSYSFRDVSNDNDAMAAHMGAFEVPDLAGLGTEHAAAAAAGSTAAAAAGVRPSGSFSAGKQQQQQQQPLSNSTAAGALSSRQSRLSMDKARKIFAAAADAVRAADTAVADGDPTNGSPSKAQQQQQGLLPLRQRKRQKEEQQLLHVYSIAAPGMRRSAESTQELAACAAWSVAVNIKRGWRQKQKGFFEAPGEPRTHHWQELL
jgi:hypothetical protein